MKWTPVGSHGLVTLASERNFFALEELQDGSHGPTHASTWQADHHTPDPYRQFKPLKALFFLVHEHIGSRNKATEHVLWTCHGKYSCFCHFGGSTKWL
jgi:hypothetical protein